MNFFAVFGNPILHSKSPQMLNNAFQKNGLDNYYTRIWARTGEQVVDIIRDINISGANITSPFKETVIPHLDQLSDYAESIEAVNTIVNDNGKLTGYNTDPFGVSGAIKEAGVNLQDSKCIVFGAGGAGKAAAYGLLKAGAEVTLTNRTYSKAKETADRFGCKSVDLNQAVNNVNDYDVVVMALLPGVWPIDNSSLKPGMVILNSVYSGVSGKDKNNDNDYVIIDGLRWLLHHAAECFKYFSGHKADINALEEGIKQNLEPDKVKIKLINDDVFELISKKSVDLLLPCEGLNQEQIEQIIKDEKKHAFGL